MDNGWMNNGCTLDEGKTRNTRTTWTLPSLSLSLCVFLGLRCITCVVLPGGTNRHRSPSASVTHLLKSKEEEEEKHKRPTNGLEKTGVWGGCLCRRKWVVTYDHGEEQWVVAIITDGWTFSSLYQCACDSQVGYPLVGQRWDFDFFCVFLLLLFPLFLSDLFFFVVF